MPTTTETAKAGAYDFTAIEQKWRRYWEEHQTFAVGNPGEPGFDARRPKHYVLDFFPYPSGAGLHVGHPIGYIATDIYARYLRMRGYNVLHPMGFDAFGLPAEQYAIETGIHPAITTRRNIETYRKQLRLLGFSYDWSRELATCEPAYYRWTQWIFVQLYKSWYDESCEWTDPHGRPTRGRARPIAELVSELESGVRSVNEDLLTVRSDATGAGRLRAWSALDERERATVLDNHRLAYVAEVPVNWCPALGTVLANEEVTNEGRSERGDHPVFRRPLRQWMMRITAYADRLLVDLDELGWPEAVKLMQRNWIGRSEGAIIRFPIAAGARIQEAGARIQEAGARIPSRTVGGGAAGARIQDAGARIPSRTQAGGNPFPRSPSDSSSSERTDDIAVYTTRPDTIFGATYMVLAPEHPLVVRITTSEQRDAVDRYVASARNRSDLERTAESKQKTGVFTGAYAINPATGDSIPIWIADYVLMGYGTGAIMAVPGGDQRDYEFAQAFDLPIIAVVSPPAEWIIERAQSLTTGIEETARNGFDALRKEVPELAEQIHAHQARSAHLQEQTLHTLVERVGVERLIEHRNRHPQAWGAAYCDEGITINSPPDVPQVSRPASDTEAALSLNGLSTPEAKRRIVAWLETSGLGQRAVKYKLRDWVFSRQKYWGEPFPIVHGPDGQTAAVDESELPVELPEMEDFKPVVSDDPDALPQPPLGRAKEWVAYGRGQGSGVRGQDDLVGAPSDRDRPHDSGLRTQDSGLMTPDSPWQRDLNTMPQWAGSCWYYLRFIDPKNDGRFVDPAAEKYWMPVDLYVGGAEHAVLHLLYARFWHKALFDLGHVSTREPFARLINQGMVQSFAYKDRTDRIYGWDKIVENPDGTFAHKETGEPLTQIVAKMSKALKNVVNPDEIIAQYGADAFRLYEMYMGPIEASKPWNTRDIPGLFKLVSRIWRLVVDEQTGDLSPALVDTEPDEPTLRLLHKTIKKVGADLEAFKFNTAIAALFDFVNEMMPRSERPRSVIETFVLLIAPLAPHLAEELWQRLGHDATLAYHPWPKFDESLARDATVEIAVQINGKVRSRVMVSADGDDAMLQAAAMADDKVRSELAGKAVRKVIVAKGRLVNIVVN